MFCICLPSFQTHIFPLLFFCSLGLKEGRETKFSKSINVNDDRMKKFLLNNPGKVYKMRSIATRKAKYKVVDKFTRTGAYVEITVSRVTYTYANALKYLDELRKDFPDFVLLTQGFIAKRFINEMDKRAFLPRGHGRYYTLYDFYKSKKTKYTLQLKCSLVVRDKPDCWVHVAARIL